MNQAFPVNVLAIMGSVQSVTQGSSGRRGKPRKEAGVGGHRAGTGGVRARAGGVRAGAGGVMAAPGRDAGGLLRLAGAALLIATGAIHLDLYLTGYRTIPTIGWLFLLQVISAFVLAAAVLAVRHWLAAAAGAGFFAATLAGYLVSVWVGLFGFREVRTTAGIVAGIIEAAGLAVLGAAAVLAARRSGALAGLPAPLHSADRAAWPAVGGLTVAALVLLGVALAGAGAPAPAAPAAGSGAAAVKTARIGGKTVLTNAKGLTLYLFVPDKHGTSTCYGSCAVYWPPVPGPATAGAGVTGTLGTTRRTDGTLQATYDGHPLYTYVGDSGPGQAHGNNITLNGGLWLDVPVSG
jgi:predicted lipoprotein with Yx(FWY)xxD motif